MDDAPNGEAFPESTGEHRTRSSGRRNDDITLLQIWRLLQRSRWLVAFAIALASGGTWVSGQAWGPVTRKIGRVDGRVTMLDSLSRIEVLQLRATDAALRDQVNDLADHQKLSTYLICTFTRRNDPAAVPPECNQVILEWRRGVR